MVGATVALRIRKAHDTLCQEIYLLAKARPMDQVRIIRDRIREGTQDPEYGQALRKLTSVLAHAKHYYDAAYVSDLADELLRRLPLHRPWAA